MLAYTGAAATEAREIEISSRMAATALPVMIGALIVIQAGLLVLIHAFGKPYVFGLVPAFSFGGEHNVTALFQTLLMLSCAAMIAFNGLTASERRADRLAWMLFSLVFVYLAIDEATMIHEYASAPTHALINASWVPHFAWVLPYAAALIVLSVFLLPWFLRLDRQSQVRFVIAGGLFVSGAIGMELLESVRTEALLDPSLPADTSPPRDLTRDLMIFAEEALEMTGLAIFLHALLRRTGGLTLRTGVS